MTNHDQNPDVRPSHQNVPRKEKQITTPAEPRSFKTAFSPELLKSYHAGVMGYTYKGVSCLKSPMDLAIYMLMIHDLRPAAIIEIGSFHGGAALFYEDLCQNYGLSTRIITVDNRSLGANAEQPLESQVEFVQADAEKLEESKLHQILDTLPKPWLVIEDSAHTYGVCLAVMTYFADRMESGEHLIIEDGVIEDQGGNWRYDGGPNRAVHKFLTKRPGVFGIATEYNDFFGVNASFNPNGYLKKI